MSSQCKTILFLVIRNLFFQEVNKGDFFDYLHGNPVTRLETILWWIQSYLLKNLNLHFPKAACTFSDINKPDYIHFSITVLCAWLWQ